MVCASIAAPPLAALRAPLGVLFALRAAGQAVRGSRCGFASRGSFARAGEPCRAALPPGQALAPLGSWYTRENREPAKPGKIMRFPDRRLSDQWRIIDPIRTPFWWILDRSFLACVAREDGVPGDVQSSLEQDAPRLTVVDPVNFIGLLGAEVGVRVEVGDGSQRLE